MVLKKPEPSRRAQEERREVRNTRSRPLLESIHHWLEASLAKLSKKSDTSAAIRYALANWAALMRFCDDGHIEIDNSAAERALRAVAIGRKNYLFAGSDSGGERAAAIYSLVGSAKLNGLDPEAYLVTCWNTSLTIRSTESRSYCLGKSPKTCRPNGVRKDKQENRKRQIYGP
jgi:hypothetical protein